MADQNCLVPAIFFIVAMVFGLLTLIAKEVWRDKARTRLFAVIAIMGTIGFVMWALIYL